MSNSKKPILESIVHGSDAFSATFKKLADVKSTALFGLDANVLLLPYSLGKASHTKIRSVFKELADDSRLIVPAQAAREFVVHRGKKLAELEKILRDHSSKISSLEKTRIGFLESNEGYKKIVQLSEKIEQCKKEIEKEIGTIATRFREDIGNDPLSRVYREVFHSAVVDVECDEDQFSKEMEERFSQKIPPGYKDENKTDGGRGDLLIWKTILKVGKEKAKDFVFVTGEEKADWFVQSNGPYHPRPELMFEYWRYTQGKTFHLISLPALLELFSATSEVVEEAKLAESSEREASRIRWGGPTVPPFLNRELQLKAHRNSIREHESRIQIILAQINNLTSIDVGKLTAYEKEKLESAAKQLTQELGKAREDLVRKKMLLSMLLEKEFPPGLFTGQSDFSEQE